MYTSAETVYFVYSEVFDSTLVYDDDFPAGTAIITNFNNDLSGISVPVKLRISINVSVQLEADATLTLTGTDISGTTFTEDFDLNTYLVGTTIDTDLTTTQAFATITRVESTGVIFAGSAVNLRIAAGQVLCFG